MISATTCPGASKYKKNKRKNNETKILLTIAKRCQKKQQRDRNSPYDSKTLPKKKAFHFSLFLLQQLVAKHGYPDDGGNNIGQRQQYRIHLHHSDPDNRYIDIDYHNHQPYNHSKAAQQKETGDKAQYNP